MDSISVYCPYCGRHTAVTIAVVPYPNRNGEMAYIEAVYDNLTGSWFMGECNNCHNVMLMKDQGRTIFPYPMPSPTDTRIPGNIREDLIEAKACFSINAHRGCVVLARRALQSTCKDKGATEKDLMKQIDELFKNGIITVDLKEWAHLIRWVGNDAAHPNKDAVAEADALDILELTEQFLQTIYVAPAIAKERRELRGR